MVRFPLAPAGALLALAVLGVVARAEDVPGEAPALDPGRPRQEAIAEGRLPLLLLRRAGLRIFTTPFNRLDGYGDGPFDASAPLEPGGRPTLQGNGTFLRANGLDAQTCLECHSIVSNASIPARLGIGGVGGSNANALIRASRIEVADQVTPDGRADLDGRFANPPFLFGAGAVELLAKEMTEELQALAAEARARPGEVVPLLVKGVPFGTLVGRADGTLDTSGVEGVDDDLVVRPFGRKGEFPTIRSFDVEAVRFHFGMQPVEIVGEDVDADGDGVANEILEGDLSLLSIFAATLERPTQDALRGGASRGQALFADLGCAGCHVPALHTRRRALPLTHPEVPTRPFANEYYRVDLTRAPPRFQRSPLGGIVVPLFSDLKRHDMGPDLAEDLASASTRRNREFVTPRLWGIADTAPYLHDGRATTLSDAVLAHGGEAADARDAFAALPPSAREDLLAFLRTLRTPRDPAAGLLEPARPGFAFPGFMGRDG